MTEAMIDWFTRVFDHNTADGRTAYRIVAPHVAISGENVVLDFDRTRKQWRLVQEEDGMRWEVWADSQFAGILALIAKRYGLDATFMPIEEDTDD